MLRVNAMVVCAFALIVAGVAPPPAAHAQTTASGSFRRVITEEQGAAIPGVLIEAVMAAASAAGTSHPVGVESSRDSASTTTELLIALETLRDQRE